MTLIGLLTLAVAGLIAGIVAGFLGIGGGILTVPILVQLLSFLTNPEEIAVKAVATSSLAVFITSVAGSIQNWQMGKLNLKRVIALGIPGLFTAPFGAILANIFPNYILLLTFGLLLLTNIYLIGLRKRLTLEKRSKEQKLKPAKLNPVVATVTTGGVGGILAGLFGVGGGVIMVPLQILLLGEAPKSAIQTSLGAIVITSFSATVTHALKGNVIFFAGIIIGIGGLVGVQISTRLLPKLPERIVTVAFRTLLMLLSVKILSQAWDAWHQISQAIR
ncbi:MAG: sulfite exporter TauE/SafE family protein [Xenococcus sp. MO_188.B8]|nr:sulfite exporter TauE/SafE family protein [Xenococcus sp. MO_188.B8]